MFDSRFNRSAVFAVAFGCCAVALADSAEASRYCDREARDYADARHRPGEAAAVSGLGSAAVGAIIGGIVGGGGGAGRGAIIGGSAGAIGGAIGSSSQWNDAYNYAYRRCIDAAQQPAAYDPPETSYAPPEGSQEWMAYCARKYKSFDPQTGMYLSYSGKYRRCR